MTVNKIRKSVIKAAEHLKVDVSKVIGTGTEGKVTVKDVEAHARTLKNEEPAQASQLIETITDLPMPKVKAPKGKYVCVFLIKEGPKKFPVGTEYTGENAEYLKSRKSIKEV